MAQFIQVGSFIFAVDNVAYIRQLHDDSKYDIQVCFVRCPESSWLKFPQADWDNRRYVDIMAKPMPRITDETSLVDLTKEETYAVVES